MEREINRPAIARYSIGDISLSTLGLSGRGKCVIVSPMSVGRASSEERRSFAILSGN